MTPKMLQGTIDELKSYLEDKDAPFGVDLALPQVGGNARKTNVRSWSLRGELANLNRWARSMIIPTANLENLWISSSPARRSCSFAQSASLRRR